MSPQGRLPDNVAPNQFDARVVEFDKHVNPALEMKYSGQNYVKLLLKTCIPPCLETDGRLLRREFESAKKMDDEAHAKKEMLLTRGHKAEAPLPPCPGLRETVMAIRPVAAATKKPAWVLRLTGNCTYAWEKDGDERMMR